MSATKRVSPSYSIYPAKYFPASPTYDKWVKITAADVHALRTEPGFEGQNIYFHLNHPIQYVYLVAPIVGIEDTHPLFTIITLDDSSGACIDVKIVRKDKAKLTEEDVSNTSIDNLSIESRIGVLDVIIDGKIVDIGTVIKAKCTIGSWYGEKQLELKRVSIMKDTNEEVAAWRALAAFKQHVLSKPWVLTSKDRADVDERLVQEEKVRRDEEIRYRQKMRRLEERKKQHAIKLSAHEQRAELRRKEAEKKYDAGALPGSNLTPSYWDSTT